MTNNNDLDMLDALAIFSVILQVMTYQESKEQSTNDDLMRELRRQDKEYFDQIIENQKKILSILSKMDMSVD